MMTIADMTNLMDSIQAISQGEIVVNGNRCQKMVVPFSVEPQFGERVLVVPFDSEIAMAIKTVEFFGGSHDQLIENSFKALVSEMQVA